MGTLLLKAEHNRKVGFLSEKEHHYDAAVSRYYYEIFQKVRVISANYEIPQEDIKTRDYHYRTINSFIKGACKIENKLPEYVIRWINKIENLRMQRNNSDYNDDMQILDASDYKTSFKNDCIKANEAIERILKKMREKRKCV